VSASPFSYWAAAASYFPSWNRGSVARMSRTVSGDIAASTTRRPSGPGTTCGKSGTEGAHPRRAAVPWAS
jgi:hypothetical protein